MGWSGDSTHDQVHLLGRGPGLLKFRNGDVACAGVRSYTLGRLLCKSCLRFFPLDTAPVVRRVVAPAATALRLLPWGREPTGDGNTHARRTGGVTAVTLRVSEALAALSLHVGLLATYDSTDTRRPQRS